MKKLLSDVYSWLDERLEITHVLSVLLDEPIPGGARWSYIFGSGLLFLFGLQALTGVFLTMYYVPSAEHAHTTVAYIQKVVTGGAFIRGLHHWGSSTMVVLLGVHMLQVFFWGAYKKPREMVWLFGAVLMLLILGFSFTGYLLPWDQKAYFATAVGTNVASEVPAMGSFLKAVALGGSSLGTIALSRFYTLHAWVLPGLTLLFISLHLFAFRKAGPAGPYRADDPRIRSVEPFFPRQFLYDSVFAALLFVILAFLAAFSPAVLEPKANPSDASYLPRPEWYFLPLFQLLKVFQGELVILGTVILPGVLFTMLFMIPFIDRSPERNPFRRPVACLSVIMILLVLGGLLLQAKREDGAFMAEESLRQLLDVPQESIGQLSEPEKRQREAALNRSALDKQSSLAIEFLNRPFEPAFSAGSVIRRRTFPPPPPAYAACSECHGDIGGSGGLMGADISGIGAKYTKEQLQRLLLSPGEFNIEGMPIFSDDKMDPAERNALVEYLISLNPPR